MLTSSSSPIIISIFLVEGGDRGRRVVKEGGKKRERKGVKEKRGKGRGRGEGRGEGYLPHPLQS